MTNRTSVPYEEVFDKWMQNPKFRKAYEELEPAYPLTRLRIEQGLTQAELADMIGTTQSSIARMEAGKSGKVLMQRMADALGAKIVIVPVEETPASSK